MFSLQCVSVSAAGHTALFYTPVDVDAPQPSRSCMSRAVLKPRSVVKIQLPRSRCNNNLWVWLIADEKVNHDQIAERRTGYCLLRDVDRMRPKAQVDCEFVHINGNVVGHASFVVTQNTASRSLVSPQRQLVYEGADMIRMHDMVCAESRFFKHTRQNMPNVGDWTSGGKNMPVGPLPVWAFVYEYAHPRFPQPDVHKFLHHCLYLATQRLGLGVPESKAELPDANTLIELMGEMATVITATCVYRLDTVPSDRCVQNDGDDRMDDESLRMGEDQWVHPMALPDLSLWGMDCEDSASVIFFCLRVLQTFTPQARVHPWLLEIHRLSQYYFFFFTIGVLRLAGGTANEHYTFHAFVTGVPALTTLREWQRDGLLLPESPSLRRLEALPTLAHPLPILTFEGTEYTTTNTDFTAFPDRDLFVAAHTNDPQVHCKIPSSFIKDSHQYQRVIQCATPHLFDDLGTANLLVTHTSAGEPVIGVTFQQWQEGAFSWGKTTTDWDRASMELVRRAVSQLPRSQLPSPPRKLEYPLRRLDPTDSVLLYVRGSDATPEFLEAWKKELEDSGFEVTLVRTQLFDKCECVYAVCHKTQAPGSPQPT